MNFPRNTPYYPTVTGPDMGLILVVNNTSDDYFYNIFNSIGFSVSFLIPIKQFPRMNRQTKFLRFKFTVPMSSPTHRAAVLSSDLSVLVRKSSFESTPTASHRKETFWATKLISGNACSLMKNLVTMEGTRGANAFWTARLEASKLCAIAFHSTCHLQAPAVIRWKFAHCNMFHVWTNIEVRMSNLWNHFQFDSIFSSKMVNNHVGDYIDRGLGARDGREFAVQRVLPIVLRQQVSTDDIDLAFGCKQASRIRNHVSVSLKPSH